MGCFGPPAFSSERSAVVGSGFRVLTPGDLVSFDVEAAPKGPKAVNVAVMFSSAHEPSVAVYPDSGKVGVWAPGVDLMFREAEGNVAYYDGETG
jgi:hypothetical protein